jgi:hypothetical protein
VSRCDESLQASRGRNGQLTCLGATFPDQVPAGAPGRRHFAVSASPRCMQEMCWFTPARAYVLGLYVDEGALGRALVTSPDALPQTLLAPTVDKTFVIQFVSSKDSRHIKTGFRRSLSRSFDSGDTDAADDIATLIGMLPNADIQAGDCLYFNCLVSENRTVLTWVPKEGQRVTKMVKGSRLGDAFHGLYLAEKARYPRMKRDLSEVPRARLELLG